MKTLSRLLIIPILLGGLLGLDSLNLGSASAQANLATVTCAPAANSCTVTLNFSVAAGSSFTAALSNGTMTTISCPQACVAGSQYTVSMESTSYSVPQTTVATQTVAPGGLCVNGSVPGPTGCTSTSLGYYPYTSGGLYSSYLPLSNYPGYFGGYSSSYYPGYVGGYSSSYYPGFYGGYSGCRPYVFSCGSSCLRLYTFRRVC
ncbi:MAG TPA: hypothetical protein VK821_21530 [Dehalococcoidia bacterium]|nr:hypothetical protein [Dehalococcoidia bacterium]